MNNQWIHKIFSALLIAAVALAVLPAKPAYADVVILNPWTNIASTGASGNNDSIAAGNLTVSAGANRLFVAAVCMELSGPNTITSLDMTLGSATLTEIGTTTGNNTEKCYMGYLVDSQIPSGSNALTVTYNIGGTTTTVTGAHVYWASFTGVSQTDPVNDSDQESNGAANVDFNSAISYLDNGVTFYVAANIGSPATMTAPTGFSQVLATTTNGHSSFIGSITTAPHNANGSYPGGTTVNFGGTTGARSSLVVASLTPVYTITVTTGANGTITPAGPAVSVNPGDDEDFVIAPNANHIVADVLVDGVSQGRINYYEFENVLTNHAISATFEGGWYAPSANVNGMGGAAFSNPGNAYSSDNARATGGNNDNVTYNTFNIPAIPAGATINGIEVALEGNDNGRTVTVAISGDGGSTYAPTSNVVNFTTTDSTIIAGSPTNLWGGTWTDTSFTNANFRVRLTSQAGGGPASVNIDQLQVKVYYTVTPTLSITNSPVTYNGSPQAANVTCSSGGTVSNILYDGSGTIPTNAGTYAVTADCAAVPGFTSLTNASAGNFVIDPAAPTASITNSPVIYNGLVQTATVACSGGGTATLASGGTGTDAGSYPATVDCAASANYTAASGLAAGNFVIDPASQTITVTTSAPSSAANSTTFNVAATASSGLPVAITTSGSCSGSGTDNAAITMTSGTGTCSVFYNQAGNANYAAAPQVQEDVSATESPSFTSANNASFDVGFAGTFTITAVGNPSTMTISISGSLPSGVVFSDNGDGTATLNGTPAIGSNGVYNLIFTADNGVAPNGIQNFSLTVRSGPTIDANGVGSVPDTGDGSVIENEIISTTLNLTQLTVEFSQDVYNPAGDSDADDVTNPANYLLVRGSASGVFNTASCDAGVVPPDLQISVDSVAYDNGGGSGPFVATLTINSGLPLNVAGFYRLYVCGTTSIVDALNTSLALAGDGVNPGTDFVRNFRLQEPASGGGGGDGGGTRGTPLAATSLSGFLIPVTGFTPNQVTRLPAQPLESAYTAGRLTIEIPSLSLNLPIVGVQIQDNGWDVTWLGNNAGYLEGSAYPTWKGNTVITGHVTDSNGGAGPFAYLNELKHGDQVYIHNNGFIYVYEVRKSRSILPRSIHTLFKTEEYDWLTLVTCENYNAKTDTFTHRRMVRAALISVIPAR